MLKDIKNVHLGVYPPTGRVRISAPRRMSLDTIRLFAISKLAWIKQQQRKLRAQDRETPREYLDRESHYVWGTRYLLKIMEEPAAPRVELSHRKIILRVASGTTDEMRRETIAHWYREQIKAAVPDLIAMWEPIMGVKVERIFVQKIRQNGGAATPEHAAFV